MDGASMRPEEDVTGEDHWTQKGDARIFLYEKYLDRPSGGAGTIVFVHVFFF